MGLSLPEAVAESFLLYLQELQEWNTHINLTSLKKEKDIIVRHFFDSFALAEFINPDSTVLDIGSGAGFPGLPLKMIIPSIKAFLLDSSLKRCTFLRHIIRRLAIEDVFVINKRVEDIYGMDKMSERFDVIVSRASISTQDMLNTSKYALNKRGRIALLKGKNTIKEVTKRNYDGYKVAEIKEIPLPSSLRKTFVAVIKRDVSRETSL